MPKKGRKSKKSTGGDVKPIRKPETTKIVSGTGSDEDEIYDAVDRFHSAEDKEMSKFKRKPSKVGNNEVLGVYSSESEFTDDDDDDEGEEDVDFVDEEIREARNDTTVRLSTDAWGKARRDFYGDIGDKDYGGFREEEAEQLELEEEDAVARQKKLDQGLEGVDFGALLESSDDEDDSSAAAAKKKKKQNESAEGTQKTLRTKADFAKLSKDEQLAYLAQHVPSLQSFLAVYDEKTALWASWKPLLVGILQKMKNRDCDFTTQISTVLNAYVEYAHAFAMFFYLVLETPIEKFKNIENHPIVDQIIKFVPIMKKVENFMENNERRLRKLNDNLQGEDGDDYAEALATPGMPLKKRRPVPEGVKEATNEFDIFARMARGEGAGKKVKPHGPALPPIEEVEAAAAAGLPISTGVGGGGDSDDDEGPKRQITREMRKNRGLTVNRKKETSHSRIKKRLQYKKAQRKHNSQIPQVRREIKKYDGEKRGIRAGVVRSVKLKA